MEDSNGSNDETVSQFLTFTACSDIATAKSYLEMSGGSLDMAVGLFMEHKGGGDVVPSAPSPMMNPPSRQVDVNQFFSSGSIHDEDDDDDDVEMVHGDVPTYNPPPSVADCGGVRAPDPTRRERLIDGIDSIAPSLMNMGAFTAGGDVRERLNRAAAVGPRTSVEGNEDDEDVSSRGHFPSNLSDMFAPPERLRHVAGGFQGARNRAKDECRWLLVNLQRDSVFACHALNRDVWRNDLVEALVRSSFVFWQTDESTDDGSTYARRYGVMDYPHVAILDPRTGRLMWKKEGWTQINPMTEEEFTQIAADFCSQNTFEKPPVINQRELSNMSSSTSADTIKRSSKRPVEELSEQEQLELAIRESQCIDVNDDDDNNMDDDVIDNGINTNHETPVDTTSSQPIPTTEEVTKKLFEPEKLPAPKPKTLEDELLEMKVGDEPASDAARLQIRMPNGTRVVRKFRNADPVKIIYAYVAQSSEDVKNGEKRIDLIAGFPPKNLFDIIDESIQSSGLSGGSITVRWK